MPVANMKLSGRAGGQAAAVVAAGAAELVALVVAVPKCLFICVRKDFHESARLICGR